MLHTRKKMTVEIIKALAERNAAKTEIIKRVLAEKRILPLHMRKFPAADDNTRRVAILDGNELTVVHRAF